MAPGNNALKYCICCKQYITVQAERTHRRAMFSNPYTSARPESAASKPLLNLNSVFEPQSHSTAMDSEMGGTYDDERMDKFMDIGSGDPEDTIEEAQDINNPTFPSHAAGVQDDGDSDIDDDEVPLEDPEEPGDGTSDEDIVDWENIEVELVSMDTSGNDYAANAAEVGMSLFFSTINHY